MWPWALRRRSPLPGRCCCAPAPTPPARPPPACSRGGAGWPGALRRRPPLRGRCCCAPAARPRARRRCGCRSSAPCSTTSSPTARADRSTLLGRGASTASFLGGGRRGFLGSAYLYLVVPRVILFREEHSRRVLVDRVDFVSAPGSSAKGIYRTGGPHALLTSMGVFMFDPQRACFRLVSMHPGRALADLRAATGFDFDVDPALGETPPPSAFELALLRGCVLTELAQTYPDFAARFHTDLARKGAADPLDRPTR